MNTGLVPVWEGDVARARRAEEKKCFCRTALRDDHSRAAYDFGLGGKCFMWELGSRKRYVTWPNISYV